MKFEEVENQLGRSIYELLETVEDQLPEFARACKSKGAKTILVHQDAFASDYQPAEYTLLGMAIKYAGLQGKTIRIIGTNRATLKSKSS